MGPSVAVIQSIGIALGALVLGLVLDLVVKYLLARWRARRLSIHGVELRLDYWNGPLRALIPALCLDVALYFVRFPADVTAALRQGLLVWLIVAAAWFCARTISLLRDLALSRVNVDAKDNLRARQVATQLKIIERMATALLWFVAAGAVLMSFSEVREFGVSILASAGVAGIILGFAAQRTLGTIFAGIQIAIAQPIRLDDVVIVEGEWGWIEEINLTFVVVRIWDQRRLVLPITYFIEKPFQNWTRTTAELLGTVFLYADYTVPVNEVRGELKRILAGTPLWNGKAWALQVTDAKQHTVELRALMSANDSSSAWDLRCLVREKLLEFLQARFPQSLPRTRLEVDRRPPTADRHPAL